MKRHKLLINAICFVLFTFTLIPQLQTNAQTYVSGDFEYVSMGNYIELIKYNGNDSIPVIPASIDGVVVKSLSGTFEGNESVTSIIIPEGITAIGDYTFKNCINLKSIKMPSTLSDLGDIDYGYAFNCYNLETFEVHPDNKFLLSENGILFNKDKSRLKLYPQNKKGDVYTVPVGVKFLASKSFYRNRNVKKLILSKTVTGVDIEAWYGNNFKEVVIPDNVFSLSLLSNAHWKFTVYGYKYSTAIRETKKGRLKYKYISVKAPGSLKVINNKGLVNTGWKPSSNASGYEIWRADPNCKYKNIATIKNKDINSFTDKKVKRNTTYKYCVKSYRMVKQGKIYDSKTGKDSYPVKKLLADKNAYISVKVK